MSQVIFNSYIDLKNVGSTPSGYGYTVAYDTDGILKQKDQDGVITPIGGGSQTLAETLRNGNNSGTYSVIMGTATNIQSLYQNTNIRFDYGNTASVAISATANNLVPGLTSSVYSTGYATAAIPDGFNTGSSINFILATVSVADTFKPTNIFVRLEMQHDYFTDLIVNLKAPTGNVINIGAVPTPNQSLAANFTTSPSYPTFGSPYNGTYRFSNYPAYGATPSFRSNVTNLAGLMGSSTVNGNWVLYVEDASIGDFGTFSKFDIWFEYSTGEVAGTVNQTRRDGVFVENYKDNLRTNMVVSSTTFSSYVGTTTYSTYIENTGLRFSMGHRHVGIGGAKIFVIDSGKTYDNGSTNKAYLHLNSFGSSTAYGVRNSVIVGGTGLWASQSYTTYLGNYVNINNRYTLPNTDGLPNQILRTDGSGTVSWATFSITTLPLDNVLSAGNYSGPNSIVMAAGQSLFLGTGSTIKTNFNNSLAQFDYQGTSIYISPNGFPLNGFGTPVVSLDSSITMATMSIDMSSDTFTAEFFTASVATANLVGLKYTTDYSNTFVDESLITKRYVDTNSIYQTEFVAYVDPNRGNDSTGQVNRPARPYQTISAAVIGVTGSSYSFASRGMVHLRKGNYTSVATLYQNIDYYCENGVVFTQNGFRDVSAVTANIYGHASFIGTDASLVPLILNYGSTVTFNFDVIDNTQAAARVYGGVASNLTMNGNRITTKSAAGYGLSFEGPCNVDVYVRDFIKGAYRTINFNNSFSGLARIQTPLIYSDGSIGSGGVTTQCKALYSNSSTTGTVNIFGDLSERSTSYAGLGHAAVLLESGNLNVHGNISGNLSQGLRVSNDSPSTNTVYKVKVKGDVTSQIEAIYHNHDYVNLSLDNSLIRSEGLGALTQSVYIGASGSVYFNNSTIYNGLDNSSLIRVDTEDSMIGIYNSLGYSPGIDGNSVLYNSALDYTIGFSNFRSNKDNGDNITDLFDPSGFIYDPYLFVPYF